MGYKSKGNAIVVILIVVVLLLIGGYIVFIRILPGLVNKGVNTIVDKSIESIKTVDFTKAQVLPIKQDTNSLTFFNIVSTIGKGQLIIDGINETFLNGQIEYLGKKPSVDYKQTGKTGLLTIQSTDEENEKHTLHLPAKTPANVTIAAGAANINLDFTNTQVTTLNLALGAGEVDVTFSGKHSITANLAAGVGKLNMRLPKNAGIKIKFTQGVVSDMKFGDSYEKVGDAYQTKNYSKAGVKIDLNIGQAIGGINIEAIE